MAVTVTPSIDPSPDIFWMRCSYSRSMSSGFSPTTNGVIRSISSGTPAPQYASPVPTIPASVYTRTSVHGKFPSTIVVWTSVISTSRPPPRAPVTSIVSPESSRIVYSAFGS
jgi:hypothetical protein